MTRLLAAVALAFALALAAADAHAVTFGFNDNSVAWGQLTPKRAAALHAAAGATTTRITFDWRWAERTPGAWRLATYDAIYRASLRKRIRPTFVLLNAPQWTWASGVVCVQVVADCRYPPSASRLDAWRAMVRKLVRRYPRLAAIEIWNEPNLTSYWQSGPDPLHYARMVIEARAAVRRARSRVKVLGGALAGTNEDDEAAGRPAMAYRRFLQGMYAARVKGHMHALSLHPYPDDIDLWRFYKMLTEVREIRDAAGDRVPLAVTELGVTTVGRGSNFTFDETTQALAAERLYGELAAMPDVSMAVVHTLVEPTRFPETDSERGFGVVRPDGTPKPAFCALARINGRECAAAPPARDAAQDLRWEAQVLLQAAVDAARRFRADTGSYTGLSTEALRERDPRLSAAPADQQAAPGPDADPSRIAVEASSDSTLLCNLSRAERSYCVRRDGDVWRYGNSTGGVAATARELNEGRVWWW